jgi:hypothetical protein
MSSLDFDPNRIGAKQVMLGLSSSQKKEISEMIRRIEKLHRYEPAFFLSFVMTSMVMYCFPKKNIYDDTVDGYTLHCSDDSWPTQYGPG